MACYALHPPPFRPKLAYMGITFACRCACVFVILDRGHTHSPAAAFAYNRIMFGLQGHSPALPPRPRPAIVTKRACTGRRVVDHTNSEQANVVRGAKALMQAGSRL